MDKKEVKWGIIGAMSSETALIRGMMEDVKEHKFNKSIYWEGTLWGKKVVLTTCGIAKVNAAACTQRLIDIFNVDYIINTGIAGAMAPHLKILDVVISDTLNYHDADLEIMKKYEPFVVNFPADKDLIKAAKDACDKVLTGESSAYVGRIVSGDQFITDSKVKKDIYERFEPMCVEMEGAAIGHVCFINGVGFVVIRTMSDNADDGGCMDYDKFEHMAAEVSAKIVSQLIKTF